MIKIAYILSAYQDPEQLFRLVEALDPQADFYVHVDLWVDITPFRRLLGEKVRFVKRHRVSWGAWSQVEYQQELLGAAINSGVNYNRIVCLTGTDYPLWSNGKIAAFFTEHPEVEYVCGANLSTSPLHKHQQKVTVYHFFRDLPWKNRWLKNKMIVASRWLFKTLPLRKKLRVTIQGRSCEVYFGSDLWAMTLPCAEYVYHQLCRERELKRYFATSFAPSELCIPTLVFNSPFAGRALLHNNDYLGLHSLTPLHYIEYNREIKVFKAQDLNTLCESGKMFFRKATTKESTGLLNQLNRIRSNEETA